MKLLISSFQFDFFNVKLIAANFRLPIWPYAKLILSCWLVLPHFNGAAHVYRHYLRPFYMNPQLPKMPQMPGTSQMWYVPRKNIFSKQDDVLTAAERYMQEHGTEAFERLISKVHKYITYVSEEYL
jgi:receptor expression-enhancing protein 5/6